MILGKSPRSTSTLDFERRENGNRAKLSLLRNYLKLKLCENAFGDRCNRSGGVLPYICYMADVPAVPLDREWFSSNSEIWYRNQNVFGLEYRETDQWHRELENSEIRMG